MSGVTCFIGGMGLLGPGLPGWSASQPVLRGAEPWRQGEVAIPPPSMLAAVERRRTSLVVRLALAAASAAIEESGFAAGEVDTVFASSNGDGAVVGAILDALATPGGDVSPTQFHNSVHNAAAGYWGIGAHSMRPSISLGCHRDSVPMGLLHAAAQAMAHGTPVLFCAYDAPLPEPLAPLHPTGFPFAMACVLHAQPWPGSSARLTLRHEPGATREPPEPSPWQALEDANPAARAMPLLAAIASGGACSLRMPLLDEGQLVVEVTP